MSLDHPTTASRGAAPEAWLGRVEEREGALGTDLAGMLGAALGHPAAPARDLSHGAPMPTLWHWAAFPEFVPMEGLGRDGHPALGRFLPDLGLPRRMWAGGRLSFAGRLHLGERLSRRSEIVAISEKTGTAGRMAFVKVAHVIEGARGGRVEEEQDIVYLEMADAFRPPNKVPAPEDAALDGVVAMSQARLFRFSAATFNAHRIHYDLPYAQEVEKYPGLVVHGPLQAMLLIEAAERQARRSALRFRFRGIHPMFHDSDLRLLVVPEPGGMAATLSSAAAAGHVGLEARVEWAR